MSIETAVIPVAGAGTHNLPATSAIDKCMLPVYVGDRSIPLIHFMVQDCVTAGLKRIIFITTPRGQQQLQHYFHKELPDHFKSLLAASGKHAIIGNELERRNSNDLTIEYIVQPPKLYGSTVPLAMAKPALQGEKHFALMGGDDFVYHPDGTSEIALAIKGWESSGADHAIMGLPVEREQATKYGVLQTSDGFLTAITEKPPLEYIPQHPTVNISQYLLSDTIWQHIDAEMAIERGQGEHYITYPITEALADNQSFYVHGVTGYYMDGGGSAGLRHASNFITEHPPLQ